MTNKTIKEILGVPSPQIFGASGTVAVVTNPELVMGVEIETENCRHGAGTYGDRLSGLGWQVTTDGSLRGVAFEFISLPMKHKHLIPQLEAFYKVTGFTEDNYTDRCSIHVHVNCTDLTVDQLSSVALIYSIFEETLFSFVGNNRDSNIYCIPWNQCRYNTRIVNNINRSLSVVPKQWQKYTALNLVPLQSIGTVEFRHMHGSANIPKITTWLNLIGSIFQYATRTEFAEVTTTIKQLNTFSNYEQFFHQVFGELLPYTDATHRTMEEGVISAKLGLIGYDPSKKEDTSVKKNKASIEAILGTARTDADTAERTFPRWEDLRQEHPAAPPAILQGVRRDNVQTNRLEAGLNPVAVQVSIDPEVPLVGVWLPPRGTRTVRAYSQAYGNATLEEYNRRSNIYTRNHPFADRAEVDHFVNSPEGLRI